MSKWEKIKNLVTNKSTSEQKEEMPKELRTASEITESGTGELEGQIDEKVESEKQEAADLEHRERVRRRIAEIAGPPAKLETIGEDSEEKEK